MLTEGNTKTLKGEKRGWLTGILHLAPAFTSGVLDTCPKSTAGCRASCLNTAGRGAFNTVQAARARKTRLLYANRMLFLAELCKAVRRFQRKAEKRGMRLAIRPNGTSDLRWLGYEVARRFPDVQVYDYTKLPVPFHRAVVPKNYHLTFSLSENNTPEAERALAEGYNVAVVFDTLPETFMGRKVVSGDETDLRFLDPSGVVIGLTAKGKAKKDATGFVVRGGVK